MSTLGIRLLVRHGEDFPSFPAFSQTKWHILTQTLKQTHKHILPIFWPIVWAIWKQEQTNHTLVQLPYYLWPFKAWKFQLPHNIMKTLQNDSLHVNSKWVRFHLLYAAATARDPRDTCWQIVSKSVKKDAEPASDAAKRDMHWHHVRKQTPFCTHQQPPQESTLFSAACEWHLGSHPTSLWL